MTQATNNIHQFRQPQPLQDAEREAVMAIVERLKAADARNQAAASPLREVTKTEKTFQEDSNLPVEFFDFFEIKSA